MPSDFTDNTQEISAIQPAPNGDPVCCMTYLVPGIIPWYLYVALVLGDGSKSNSDVRAAS